MGEPERIESSISESIPSKPRVMDLSPSVMAAQGRFTNEPISAAALSQQIMDIHSGFIKGRLPNTPLRETPTKRTASEWLNLVQELFDSNRIREMSKSDQPPVLHGRLVVLGLGLLEPQLRSQLQTDDFFEALMREVQPPFAEILTERGRALLAVHSDSVPSQSDDPLTRCEEDQLGRTAFARYLARRIEAVPVECGAYSIHVYGPWGSGKSTLLNFIREELKQTNKWVVTEFNAWRNQHIRPPWWSLMESVFQQSKNELSWWARLSEYWWRFKSGRTDYMIAFLILVWVLALLVVPAIFRSGGATLESWGATADGVGKIIAVIVTLWGIVIAFSRSFLFGSAKGAKTYMELAHDPMDNIKTRFTKLAKRIKNKRIVVFVDDLDRCQGNYVIELLEGIQTLFKEAPVVFVIAADRQWLNACYEENYLQFKANVCEPGKPLGTLFLEKAFQFSSPVPGIPKEFKEAFWHNLIKVKGREPEIAHKEARTRAQQEMQMASTEGNVLRLVDESRNRAFYERRAIREEAVVRLAAPEVVERTEHALMPFSVLLDPNPRSMKRLVNAYSVNRALATLSDIDIDRDRLALWTIMSLRWPTLADYVKKFPERIADISQKNMSVLPEDLVNLCNNEDVSNVIKGGPANSPLDENAIRQCSLL